MKSPQHRRYEMAALTALITCIGLTPALAQPRMDERGPRERPREGHAPPEAGRPHIERWLEQLEARDPEEYQRIMELRERHPAAFRAELRNRVHDARMMERLREPFPELHERISRLPRDERVRIGRMIRGEGDEGPMEPFRHRHGPPPDEAANAMHDLLVQWRTAEDDAAREEARMAIREHVAKVFDQRTATQEADIQRAEEQVSNLRSMLESRLKKREEWIDRIMERVLQAPNARRAERGRMRQNQP